MRADSTPKPSAQARCKACADYEGAGVVIEHGLCRPCSKAAKLGAQAALREVASLFRDRQSLLSRAMSEGRLAIACRIEELVETSEGPWTRS